MDKQNNHNSDKHKLRASEQQLKAVNQQLRASEQQLRAAIQQLEASNQQLKASEKQIRAEREKEQKYLDVAGTMMVVIDPDQKVTLINKTGCEILGYKEKQILGRNWFDSFLPESGREKAKAIFQKLMAGKIKPVEYNEGPVLTKSGKERTVTWHNAVLTNEDGDILDALMSGMDITDRKQAEEKLTEEHNLLRTLIDNMPDYIYVKDTESRFVTGNIAVARGMGATTPDGLIGKTDLDFYPEELAARYYTDEQEIIRSARPLTDWEELSVDPAGNRRWFSSTKVPLRDSHGNITGIVGISRNITERKQAREALRAANQQLQASEQQLKAANQQLGATNQQLRASEQQLKAANQQLQASEQQLKAANQQLQASEQQLRAANQQLDASNQQLRAGEEELRQLTHDLQDRVKELDCLYGLSRLDEQRDISIEQIFQGLVELIRPAWEYPEITAARIIFEGRQFKTANFRETAWSQSADIRVHGQKVGAIEVCYLQERPAIDEGPFLREETELLNALAERSGHITERRQAEGKLLDYQAQLKSLASQLSLTEEYERRRIATELHDRISQFLVISKVKLEALRESAPSADLAKALDEVRDCLDQVIQDTRSLTFDLSSPILYELGLEAAVAEWLVEQIQKKHGIASEFEDDQQPKPLDEDIRVLLFRTIRELLVNVVKHAQARKVKVSIRKIGSEINIDVEDDGVGFDLTEVASIATKTGGFGLFSIRERLERLGGHLEIESGPGRGCKVMVRAPLKREKNIDRAQI